MLQEGTLAVDPNEFRDNHGNPPPVMHVDSDAPLHDDEDGATLEEARRNLREAASLVLAANRALAAETAGDAEVIREPLKITA